MRVILDGRTLTPAQVAAVAREGRPVSLDDAARARNAAAAEALAALLDAGTPVYGVTTGVGPLRSRELGPGERSGHQLRLLRSHACGAGQPLPPERVRAALVVRANQIGAGGAGVSDDLLDASVAALNAGFVPFSRELGSLGTGDLTVLADIALALLGEGRAWRDGRVVAAKSALADAGLAAPRLGPRDGLAFMSSNAAAIGHAALVAVDAERQLVGFAGGGSALRSSPPGPTPPCSTTAFTRPARIRARSPWPSGCASCSAHTRSRRRVAAPGPLFTIRIPSVHSPRSRGRAWTPWSSSTPCSPSS